MNLYCEPSFPTYVHAGLHTAAKIAVFHALEFSNFSKNCSFSNFSQFLLLCANLDISQFSWVLNYRLLFITSNSKIRSFTPVLSTRIVLDSFYLIIFFYEKFSTSFWRLLLCHKSLTLNGEFKLHIYCKQQKSDSHWELLKIENEQIKTAPNNHYG